MKKRIKLTVAYDGTCYCGWQLQKNGMTVEQALNEAIRDLTGEAVQVTGASRTDSGVHALGNVAVFDTETPIPAPKLAFALNARLPQDIRIQKSEEAAPDFHPRKTNSIKTYEYRIWNHAMENPVRRLYDAFVFVPLQADLMRRAAAFLIGEHDFASFASAGGQAEETIRTVYSLDVSQDGPEITLRIRGNGFLYNMVRIIAGTLIEVGSGKYPPEHVKEILEARNRQAAGKTAPAKGLTLVEIAYEQSLADCLTVKEEKWAYGIWQKEILSAGQAFLYLDACVQQDFKRNVARLIKKSMRDGARRVWVCDRAGRLSAGLYGDSRLRAAVPEEHPDLLPETAFAADFPQWPGKAGLSWFYAENM